MPSRPTPSSGPASRTGKRRAAQTSSAPLRWPPPRRALRQIGLDQIAAHERVLTRYAIERLADDAWPQDPRSDLHLGATAKLGVIPFTVEGIDHALIAAVLGYEHGVGVRSGCFCAVRTSPTSSA